MKTDFVKRTLIMLAVTALVCAPFPFLYRTLSAKDIPAEMAALAVPAHHYELVTTTEQYFGENPNAPLTTTTERLICYNLSGDPIREISGESCTDYTYDTLGRLTGRTVVLPNHAAVEYTYAYDEQGRPARTISSSDTLSTETVYTYDGSGTGAAVTEYGGGYTERSIVDESGNVLTNELIDGDHIYRVDYTYNEHGDLIRSEANIDGETETVEYFYFYYFDGDGRPTHTKIYRDGELETIMDRLYQSIRL